MLAELASTRRANRPAQHGLRHACAEFFPADQSNRMCAPAPYAIIEATYNNWTRGP